MKDELTDLTRRIETVTGVAFKEIASPTRRKNVVNARAIFCHEMRFTLKYKCLEISNYINRKRPVITYFTTYYEIDQNVLNKVRSEKKETNS